MFEAVGAVIIMTMVVRLNRLMDSNLTDKLFSGLRIWMIPSADAIEGTKPPQHKRSKHPPKSKTIQERVMLLGLKRGTFSQGALARQVHYELLDNLFLFFLLAVVSMIWQWVQTLAHVQDRLLDVSGWVVFTFCFLSFFCLIRLAYKDEFGLSKGNRKAFAFSLGVVVGAIMLALPPGTTTFSVDQSITELTRQLKAWQEFVGVDVLKHFPDPTGPFIFFLALLCAIVAAALINPAFRASYTYIHQGTLHKESPLTHKLLIAEPFLCLFIFVTFFRPMLLGPLQTMAIFRPCDDTKTHCNSALPSQLSVFLPPTDHGWLQYQVLLIVALLGIRALLTRWQIQAYMEYAPIESIYALYADKDLEVAPVQQIFQIPLQSCVYIGLQLVAPMAWLASLLLLLTAKVFVPVWTPLLISLVTPGATTSPESLAINGTLIDVLNGGNITAQLGWDLAITLLDFPVLSQRCYKEMLGFLAFWTVAIWFICFGYGVLYRLRAMSKYMLVGLSG